MNIMKALIGYSGVGVKEIANKTNKDHRIEQKTVAPITKTRDELTGRASTNDPRKTRGKAEGLRYEIQVEKMT